MTYKNVLHIDDDEDDQEIFFSALKSINETIRYHSSVDAREALKKLLANELKADVIFLDLNMPVMTGQQFLSEIKKIEELQHIPVIVLSTSSQTATIEQTKELGAHDFITKPDKFDNLVFILKSILM